MDIIVRNLAFEATEKQVRAFFEEVLAKFGIHTFHCQKMNTRGCAMITIIDVSRARQFIHCHGQDVNGKAGFIKVAQKLYHSRRQVWCMSSNKPPDPFHIKALKKEESDRYASRIRKPLVVPGKTEPREFEKLRRAFGISQLKCGRWDYTDDSLAFVTEFSELRNGRLIFTNHNVFIKLAEAGPSTVAHQIEIPYSSIESFTVGPESKPFITLSLIEAPKIYEEIKSNEALEKLIKALGFEKSRKPIQTITRHRLSALGDIHQNVVASCLCYRFRLSNASDVKNVQNLKRFPEIPASMKWDTSSVTRLPFTAQMTLLNEALAGDKYALMPFDVKFQLQKLAQNGYLAPSRVVELTAVASQHLQEGTEGRIIANALRNLANQIPFAGPDTDAADLKLEALARDLCDAEKAVIEDENLSVALADQYEHISNVHKATVTPTGIYLYGPEPEVKNRVTREYSQFPTHFLSVSFSDENGEQIRFDRQTSSDEIYYGRFTRILEGVINIAGRPYEFLGFSHSSLRSQTCWFMAPFVLKGSVVHARAVVQALGNFSDIRSPAKCAARIGQAFSQTLSSVTVPHILQEIPDVERNGRNFSDGCGTCSPEILYKVWEQYSSARAMKPTVLQIRYQGAKGVISLDNTLAGNTLCLRPSMIKFSGTSVANIEICGAANKPLPMYLNRQLIKILEDLGVQRQPLMDLQAAAVEKLRMTTESSINASTFLRRNFVGKAANLPWLIRKLWDLGFGFSEDNHLRDIVEMTVLVQLRELKHRTRIPVEKGVTLYGIMDETGFLQENEVYCIFHNETGTQLVSGNVVITRCPALHPGDVQFVTAIDVPTESPLRALHNVVVFSQWGDRDLPSKLSGGDLDGDIYNVVWDARLYPTQISDPAAYPSVEAIDIGRTVERSDIIKHFVDFMINDNLGYIATLHQIIADQKAAGTFNGECVTLAAQHSTAVDFSKTGIPVDKSQVARYPKFRPDFQAPGPRVLIEKDINFQEDDEDEQNREDDPEIAEATSFGPQKIRYYESTKVLGHLYRAIDEQLFFAKLQEQCRQLKQGERSLADAVWSYVKEKTILIQWQHYIDFAKSVRDNYDENLMATMFTYSKHPLDEIGVCSGSILGLRGAQSKRQREYSIDMKEKHERNVAYTVASITHGEGEHGTDEALERSIACLFVACTTTRVRKRVGALKSFVWVAAAVCLKEVEKLPGVEMLL